MHLERGKYYIFLYNIWVFMTVLINYDFIETIRNATTECDLFKVMRNESKTFIKRGLPMFMVFNYALTEDALKAFAFLPAQYWMCIGFDWLKNSKIDSFKEQALERLDEIAMLLKELDIVTNRKLILESKLDGICRNLSFGKVFPIINEYKYVLVPSYGLHIFDTDINQIPIIQEHVVGTNNYYLYRGDDEEKVKNLSITLKKK